MRPSHLGSPRSSTAPRVCAVVLNWNGRDDTLRCLASLRRDGYDPIDVVVIDNGSSDGSREAVAAAYPDVSWVQNPENYGISRGFNQGIEHAASVRADYVFFLNNDATLEPPCLRSLVDAAAAMPEAEIVAPLIIEEALDGGSKPAIWYAGGTFSLFLGVPEHTGRRDAVPPVSERASAPREVTFATGCALLVRQRLFDRIGRFDERFFAYAEDVDLALRAREAGARILFVPWARVKHQVGATFRRTTGEASRYRLTTDNLVRLERKHARWYHWPSFFVWFGVRWMLFLTAKSLVRGDWRTAAAVWRGLYDGTRDRR
ncbi:MAG: glycosyltransferase family 2 protein [Planctomycetes bacterium]|nr:glycosyltransferase family 2 protein [Planctomycetota bacterium]MBI3846147.1 glycosyltransferase family 2 protein [Planctomycetota bacterium]